jgi:two-component system nitrate/nitrite response regulator NarL
MGVPGSIDGRTTGAPVTVVVLAGVRLFREGLVTLLAGSPGVQVVGSGPSDLDGLRRAAELQPDVALLEAAFVCDSSAAAELLRRTPRTRVVAFGVATEADDGIRCVEAGAVGHVPADASTEDLVDAVRSAAAGEFHCTPRFAALMTERLAQLTGRDPSRGGRPPRLTPRERQVAVLVDEGMSNKEIATHLGIGVSTVKNHVHHLLEKLNARRRSQAAMQVRRARIGI